MNANSICTRQRKKAKKVKSGCRICKIRKVKCDEGRPICRRCSNTGRVCEGYGVWGGGETVFSQQMRLLSERDIGFVSRPPAIIFLPGSSLEEREGFEWFKRKTAPKLPGSFQSTFWSSLLHQASLNESAVLHAVLALSSIHRGGNRPIQGSHIAHEAVALRHYGHAIKCLEPHLTGRNKSSSRIALIACVVFVNLELLRGHFQTAQAHLDNGIRILQDIQFISAGSDGVFCDVPGLGMTDLWIVESFSRLQLQSELFRCGHEHHVLLLELRQWGASDGLPSGFISLKQAWGGITPLLNQILRLVFLGRQKNQSRFGCQELEEILSSQRAIREGLVLWHDFSEILLKRLLGEERRAFFLLRTYHTLATIMVDTALETNNELIYDKQTSGFRKLLRQLSDLHRQSLNRFTPKALPDFLMDMEGSVTDIGWTAGLYYIATKYRVPSIRAEAVRLLESRSHREGMWDSKVMACVARKVVDMEEAGLRQHRCSSTVVQVAGSSLTPVGETLPPDSDRLREVEVFLLGAPLDTIMLFGKRQRDGFHDRVLLSRFPIESGYWEDH